MFWEILNGQRPDATPDEIAAAHVEVENKLKELESQFPQAHDEVIRLQMEALGFGNGGKKLQAAKDRLQDIDQKVAAAKQAMELLREKLAERLRADAQQQASIDIPEQQRVLSAERGKVHREFLEAIARAIALEEQIEGIPAGRFDGVKGEVVVGGYPQLRFDQRFLKGDDQAFLYAEVEKLRKADSPDIDRRQKELARKKSRFEELLENPELMSQEIQKFLKAAGSRFFDEPQSKDPSYPQHPYQMAPIVREDLSYIGSDWRRRNQEAAYEKLRQGERQLPQEEPVTEEGEAEPVSEMSAEEE